MNSVNIACNGMIIFCWFSTLIAFIQGDYGIAILLALLGILPTITFIKAYLL